MNQSSQIANTAQGTIEYLIKGAGEETCLLLHGGHSSCHETFGVEAILDAGMSALIPSRPGYGKTPATVGQSADEAAGAMVALLDTLSIATVNVIAISAGGPTGLHLASRYPERVEKLILESAVTKRWLTPDDTLYKTARIMFHQRLQRVTWGMLKTFVGITPNLIYRQMIPSFTKLHTATVLSSFTVQDRAAFNNMLRHLSSGSGFMLDIEQNVPTSVLEKITAPTLIVHSKNDGSVAFEHPLHAQATIRDAELFEAQTWGHLIWLGEGSTEVKAKVANFLRKP